MTRRPVPVVSRLNVWSGVLATLCLAVPAYTWSVHSGSYCSIVSRDLSLTIVWTGVAMAATVLPVGIGFLLAGRRPPRWLAWPFGAVAAATFIVGLGHVAGDSECLRNGGVFSYHLGVYALVGALGLVGLMVAILRRKADQ